MSSLKVELELTEQCDYLGCWGKGIVSCDRDFKDIPLRERKPCQVCLGTGKVPTELGRSILEFVREYGGRG